jgi:hypothetical protein
MIMLDSDTRRTNRDKWIAVAVGAIVTGVVLTVLL